MPLARHGLDDTALGLTHNTAGTVIVGSFGRANHTGVAETVRERPSGSAPG